LLSNCIPFFILSPKIPLQFFDRTRDIEEQEQLALREAEKNLETINPYVTKEIQALFDRLRDVYSDSKWNGNNIEILSEFVIEPPYDTVRFLEGKEGNLSGMDRVKKIVSKLFLHVVV